MKTFFSLLSLVLISSLVLTSCNDKDEDIIVPETPVAVEFSSGIEVTRAADNYWHPGDQIGISMIRKSKLGLIQIVDGIENRQYETPDAENAFIPVGESQKIYYPLKNESEVSFISYYPYTSELKINSITQTKYFPVDLKDQSSQEAIDLLYSNNATGYDKSKPNVKLIFEHKLAKINFNIIPGEGLKEEDLEGLQVKIKGAKIGADFYLLTGTLTDWDFLSSGDINAKTQANGQFAEAIIVPGRPIIGRMKFEFTVPALDKTYSYNVNDETPFDSGTKTIYNVTLSKVEAKITGEVTDWDVQPEKELDLK